MGGAPLTRSDCLGDDTVFDFVDGRLADDARTRVEEHLAVCSDCRTLVAEAGKYVTSADEVTRDARSAPTTAPRPLEPGAKFGRYVIRGVTGTGGMGIVYMAHDPELARDVALKLLRPDVSVADRREIAEGRLLREARAMASLSHPNVVTVYDVGTFDGQVFVAMELVEGRTLRQWLRERPRPWAEIVRVFVDAGKGLAAAHAKGLVHRDFKPGNVLLGRDDRARVTDFGLARAVRPRPEANDADHAAVAASSQPAGAGRRSWAALTETGALVGTPAYMAPEQFLLGASSDARGDQFSFCVALYEGLNGERPFGPMSVSGVADEADATRLRAPSPEIRAVLARGLQEAPERRYPSMDALLSELCKTLDLAPSPKIRRHRSFILLALTASAIAGVWLVVHAARAPSAATLRADVAAVPPSATIAPPETASAASDIDPPSSSPVAPATGSATPRPKNARGPGRPPASRQPSAERPAKADVERHGNNLLDPFGPGK